MTTTLQYNYKCYNSTFTLWKKKLYQNILWTKFDRLFLLKKSVASEKWSRYKNIKKRKREKNKIRNKFG
jgi:hypothetical protein